MRGDQAPQLAGFQRLTIVPSPLSQFVFAEPQCQASGDDNQHGRPPNERLATAGSRPPKWLSVHGYLNTFVLSSSLLPEGLGKGRRMSAAGSTVRRSQRGFTLIEIMVVVVIIGLLAAIIAPNVIGNIDKALVTRTQGDIRSIETALNLYRLDNFRYPTTDEGLQVLVAGSGGGKNYLSSVPADPWSNPYLYIYPGQQREFDVFSYGADGQQGGEALNADIGNWNLD